MKRFLLPLIALFIFTSCTKEDEETKVEPQETVTSCDFLEVTLSSNKSSVLTASQDDLYFKMWKSKLFEMNGIDEDYFNQHFKNIQISSFEGMGNITFQVDYIFDFDWIKLQNSDQFYIKINSSTGMYQHLEIPKDELLTAEWVSYIINYETQFKGTCKIKKIDDLLFSSCDEACQSFIDSTGYPMIFPDRIALHVPGKLPRIDGDPYFIGHGVIDSTTNECIKGYFNLITGEFEVHETVCVIIN